MAMGCEKSAAVFPKPGPDLFAICLWNFERINFSAGKELESAFPAGGGQRRELLFNFKQEHEPMRPALITVLADHAGQAQVRRRQVYADFLLRLAAGASVGRFANVHF